MESHCGRNHFGTHPGKSLLYRGHIHHNPDAAQNNCTYSNGCPMKIRIWPDSSGSTATNSGLSEPPRNGSVAHQYSNYHRTGISIQNSPENGYNFHQPQSTLLLLYWFLPLWKETGERFMIMPWNMISGSWAMATVRCWSLKLHHRYKSLSSLLLRLFIQMFTTSYDTFPKQDVYPIAMGRLSMLYKRISHPYKSLSYAKKQLGKRHW